MVKVYEPETILASTMFIGRVSWTSVFGHFPGKTIGMMKNDEE
jgi:hypothetical protein